MRSAGCLSRLLAATMLAALAACSSPNPRLYTIEPVQGATVSGAPKVIELRQVGLARYLERSENVRSTEAYRLDVMANDWWGEPLGAMIARLLIEELSQRLPQSTIYADTGAVSVPSDATIELNVSRLDENAAGSLVLQAQAAVTATAAACAAAPGRPLPARRPSVRRARHPTAANPPGSAASPRDGAVPVPGCASPPWPRTPCSDSSGAPTRNRSTPSRDGRSTPRTPPSCSLSPPVGR